MQRAMCLIIKNPYSFACYSHDKNKVNKFVIYESN